MYGSWVCFVVHAGSYKIRGSGDIISHFARRSSTDPAVGGSVFEIIPRTHHLVQVTLFFCCRPLSLPAAALYFLLPLLAAAAPRGLSPSLLLQPLVGLGGCVCVCVGGWVEDLFERWLLHAGGLPQNTLCALAMPDKSQPPPPNPEPQHQPITSSPPYSTRLTTAAGTCISGGMERRVLPIAVLRPRVGGHLEWLSVCVCVCVCVCVRARRQGRGWRRGPVELVGVTGEC